VTDQVMRDIEIRDTATPFRTNRTNVRHTFDNVSWMDGFDADRMEYAKIGLRSDFPGVFSAPSEVRSAQVKNDPSDASKLLIRWQRPEDEDYAGVWIYLEGSWQTEPIFVEASAGDEFRVDRPGGTTLPDFRLRVKNQSGHLSSGYLVAAGEIPSVIGTFRAAGEEQSIRIAWDHASLKGYRVRVVVGDASDLSQEVAVERGQLQLDGLQNNRAFRLQLSVRDPQGHWWPAGTLAAVSGTAVPIPLDFSAHWQFDGSDVTAGRSLGDLSGHGNTLFVDGGDLRLVESPFGQGIQFEGGPGHLRFLDATPLAIGSGDFAVSLWMKRDSSDRMAGRIIDFGGGSRGDWEHWGASREPDSPAPAGVSLISDDIQLGSILSGGGRNYQVRTKGLPLVDQWNHVVVNIERGSSMSLWLNGELLGRTTIRALSEQNLRGHTDWLIGRMAGIEHPNIFWTGALDNIRLYNRSLDDDEILALLREKENR